MRGSLVAAAAAGALARVGFLLAQPDSNFDPWRHRQLVDNLRDGLGFTLFEGQPYVWYHPLWYRFCALFVDGDGMRWIAATLSLACVPLVWKILSRRFPDRPAAAAWGAWLVAVAGPWVRFTCHDGAEAAALTLVLAALALDPKRDAARAWLSGLAIGLALVLRLNLLFNVFLFVALWREWRRALPWAAGVALPLALHFVRNARILATSDWVWSWDGLATRAATHDLGATLLLQRHPDIRDALQALHAAVVPRPLWLERIDWLLFLAVGLAVVAVGGRLGARLTAATTVVYFLAFDATDSSHFFRLWVAVFPAIVLAAASFATREGVARPWRVLPAALLLVVGVFSFVPTPMAPLPGSTAPAALLEAPAYFVNSGRYHPEALVRTYPDIRFLGLPWRVDDLDDYLADHPDVRYVLWHDFDLQPAIREALLARGWRARRTATGADGHRYTVYAAPPDPPAPSRP